MRKAVTGETHRLDWMAPGPLTTAPTARFKEDNPGRWFYHCHVSTHLHGGMNGWYLVDG